MLVAADGGDRVHFGRAARDPSGPGRRHPLRLTTNGRATDDAGLHSFAEAVLTHFQLIRPRGEVDDETAIGAAEDTARQTRGRLAS